MDCLFCKIAGKNIPALIIYEDQNNLAFLDVRPISPGHTVVIPKTHAENILDIKNESIGPLFEAVKKTTELLNKSLKPQGFNIGINHGRKAGQAIDHIHIHIIPRFDNDAGGSIHSIVKNPPKESIREIAKKIKNIKF